MVLCRLYLDHPNVIGLRGCEGITTEQADALEKLLIRFVAAPDEINIGIVGEPNVIMTRWGNLWIGIEKDGYTHS